MTTIDGLAEMLGIDPAATAKAMPIVADGEMVLALVRGDDRLHEMKTERALGKPFRPATADEIRAEFGADPGSIGAVGVKVPIIADESLREGQYVGGANRTGWHLRGVEAGRDFQAEFHDLREVSEGDACSACGDGVLHIEPAIEVGHIFKLGTRYSVPLNANYLDEAGKEHPIVMGSYGIGPARIAASAVEQNHDEAGIIWPASIAPFDVHMVVIGDESDAAACDRERPPHGAHRGRGGGALRRPRGRAGGEVHRRRAARLSRPGDGREADGDRRIGRRPGAPRARAASGTGRRCGRRRAGSPLGGVVSGRGY